MRQVRYAASVTTRTFMVAAEGWREEVYPVLLPPMCLNRRYEAEGIRLYSQQTWALVLGEHGREWVARCAPQVCPLPCLPDRKPTPWVYIIT